jgi:hypothetical protein
MERNQPCRQALFLALEDLSDGIAQFLSEFLAGREKKPECARGEVGCRIHQGVESDDFPKWTAPTAN